MEQTFLRQGSAKPDLITLELLDNLPAWRLRAVERVHFSRALWSERDREVHVKSLTEAALIPPGEPFHVPNLKESLDRLPRTRGMINLTLPIGELPKVPLLDLHITVAEKQVYRVRLDDGARIQARYIRHLSEKMGHYVDDDLIEFLTAIFYFPTSVIAKAWKARHKRAGFTKRDDQLAVIREYINNDDLLHHATESAMYEKWRNLCKANERVVLERALPDYLSGTENPLIALPHFAREMERRNEPHPQTQAWLFQKITHALKDLSNLLVQAEKISAYKGTKQGDAARKLLDAYAAYGYRWMAFARCSVPATEPFIITMKENRAIYFTPERKNALHCTYKMRNTAWKMAAFADAETNHLSIRIQDPAVRLGKCQAFTERNEKEAPHADEERRTFELYLRHDSTPDRPERIWIKCHLKLALLASLFIYLAMFVTGGGVSLLIWRGVTESKKAKAGQTIAEDYIHGLTAKDAAVILIPVAFIAAFLLVKDSSTLVVRVRWFRQLIVLAGLFALLATAFSLYVWRVILASP